MKISEEMYRFLDGVEFSNNMKLVFKEHKGEKLSRIEILETLVENKNIVHVGACDHLPLIDKKIEQNTWLHKRLQNNANSIIGIDINERAVKYTNQIGYQNIFYYDILSESEAVIAKMNELSETKWDYLVLGEMLEHVDNPVEFLSIIKNKYKENVKDIIVTVPNAFSYNNVCFLLRNMELNNSDHKFLFTPYTIMKVLTRAGMRPLEIMFAEYPSLKRRMILPWLNRDIMALSLVVIARL